MYDILATRADLDFYLAVCVLNRFYHRLWRRWRFQHWLRRQLQRRVCSRRRHHRQLGVGVAVKVDLASASPSVCTMPSASPSDYYADDVAFSVTVSGNMASASPSASTRRRRRRQRRLAVGVAFSVSVSGNLALASPSAST